jgi:hypothetical protein
MDIVAQAQAVADAASRNVTRGDGMIYSDNPQVPEVGMYAT